MTNDTPITITLTRIDLCNLALACTNARMHAGDTPNASKWTLLHDTIMAEIIAADEAAQEAPQEAPAADPAQQPTETENAPQAATEANQQPTTDEQKEEGNPMSITPAERIQACNIIIRRGGYRERDLLTRPHEMTHGETWNAAHKVVYVTETTPDPDGYRPGCAVDIVTRSIVG